MRRYPRKRKLRFDLSASDDWLPKHQLPWPQKFSTDLFQPYLVMPYTANSIELAKRSYA